MISSVYTNASPLLFQKTEISNDATFLGLRVETISKIGLGILVGVCCFPVAVAIQSFVIVIMTSYGFDLSLPPISSPNPFSGPFTVAKAAFIFESVFFGPLIEEYLFRGLLYPWMQSFFQDPKSTQAQAVCAIANGFLFGLAHFSPSRGWRNVHVIASAFFGGSVLAYLRGQTDDIVASTSAHSTHNGIVSGWLFLAST